ncbi:porin family protein [Thauera sinica]|uniref:Surface lipoprotein assembly modifier n=1 Tax=Thauera sinica TaxID=2665146 RepID=A0ABW1AS22_9RHOO|nr:porin family protein [Thauera sp. K11]ATE61528.1 hypothetical protein CCZ27_17595 [Thauera sp. K11]
MNAAFRLVRLFASGLLVWSSAQAVSASKSDILSTAREALQNGQPVQAQSLLLPVHRSGNHDNQTLFLLALSAKQLGDWAASERYLTELLQREPAASRVKLELAEIHYRSGRPEKARQLLLDVKASNPPARVGENIEAFLAFIESGGAKAWSAYAGVGLLYDSNANQGPDIDNILIYDLPFTLDRDAKGNHDWAHLYKLGAGYTHALRDDLAVQAGLHLNYTDYRRLNGFDTLNLSLSVGLGWSKDAWSFSLPYIFNVIRFGHSQRYYSIGQGLAPQIAYQVSPRLLLQGSLAWQDRRYKDNSPRNGDVVTFSPSLRYALDASSHVSVGGYAGREKAGLETYGNRSRGVEFGYFKAFDKHLNLHVSPAFSHTDYSGFEAAWQKGRVDRRTDLSASLNYLIAPWNSNLTLSFTASDNRSNIGMYRYKRQQTMVSLARHF